MTKLTLGTAMMQHPTFLEDEVLPDTADARLAEAAPLIVEAATRGCDILCLPEYFADSKQGMAAESLAEPVGGPVTTWLSDQARNHNMALVATVAIKDDRGIANGGVAYNKQGELVGRYGKVHLPPGERDKTVPGDGFDVFEIEGAKVGMQICYDLDFPEGCRILSLKGAEIIFWPNMWGGMPSNPSSYIRCATASICHTSSRASPGGSTSLNHCCVRRSVLPNIPFFSTHEAEGRITLASRVVAVGYMSETTMKRSAAFARFWLRLGIV